MNTILLIFLFCEFCFSRSLEKFNHQCDYKAYSEGLVNVVSSGLLYLRFDEREKLQEFVYKSVPVDSYGTFEQGLRKYYYR